MPRKTKSHVLTITGWRPHLLNHFANRHWAVRREMKANDALRLLVECQNQEIPRALGKRRVTLVWILGKGERAPDADGCWKSLLDGLVHAGRLRDDNPQWCELAPVQYRREAEKGIEITLEDIP